MLREAQSLGLRAAAEQLGISPAYLSRIERGGEKPPRPELIRKMATLFGGDADVLFRLAQSTDPELADYVNSVPALPEFLRTAMAARLTSERLRAADTLRSRNRGRPENKGDGVR